MTDEIKNYQEIQKRKERIAKIHHLSIEQINRMVLTHTLTEIEYGKYINDIFYPSEQFIKIPNSSLEASILLDLNNQRLLSRKAYTLKKLAHSSG